MKKIFISILILFILSRIFINEKLISVRGIGEYKEDDLITVKKTLKEYYNIDVTIDNRPIVKNEFYESNNMLDVNKILIFKFLNLFDNTVILVTSERLTDSLQGIDFKGPSLMIISSFKCKDIRPVIIHEFTHNIGFHHCNNDECYMYKKLNKKNKYYMCSNCSTQIKEKFKYP